MFSQLALILGLAVVASAAQVRINCGGPALPAIGWLADTAKYRSKPSDAFPSPKQVVAKGTWRPIYDTHAYAPTKLVYKIPVPSGPYTISLLLAETYNEEAGKRTMSIKLGSRVVRKSLDVFAAAGGALKGLFLNAGAVTVGDDKVLYLEIATTGAGNPMLSGIVIDGKNPGALLGSTPSPPSPPSNACNIGKYKNGFMMNIGGPADTKLNFAAENPKYFSGSLIATNTAKAPAAAIFRNERYTFAKTLTVRIPVPKGVYTITTSHAETYFSAAGKRTFDILVNGKELKTKVDVFALANAANKVHEAIFTDVAPVDGVITVTFRKVLENPFVNAIRIVGPGASSLAVGGGCGDKPDPNPPSPPNVGGKCRTAKTVTGAIADNSGFLMNVGGKAIAKEGWAADNVNYIPDKVKGDTFVADMPVDTGSSTWGAMWRSSRWTSLPALKYVIPAPKGKTRFRVALFLVESFFAKNGARVMDIYINGKIVDAKVDIHKRVGKNKPLYLQFDNMVPVDGKLTIVLKKVSENPTLNGIYIEGKDIGTTVIGGFEDGTC